MSRPPLGGGRSHPQCRSCLHRTKSPVAQLGTSKCCWPLRAVASPHSAVISMNAPAAGIAPPSPTTAVAIDTPKCQTAARERWIATSKRTSPHALCPCGLHTSSPARATGPQNKKVIYDLLFRASARRQRLPRCDQLIIQRDDPRNL
jgi:hypothetical protein